MMCSTFEDRNVFSTLLESLMGLNFLNLFHRYQYTENKISLDGFDKFKSKFMNSYVQIYLLH